MIRDESNLNSPKYSFSVLTILINVRVTFEKLNEKKKIFPLFQIFCALRVNLQTAKL
jgi:hypothetical protein